MTLVLQIAFGILFAKYLEYRFSPLAIFKLYVQWKAENITDRAKSVQVQEYLASVRDIKTAREVLTRVKELLEQQRGSYVV